jgi:hypothetical protein
MEAFIVDPEVVANLMKDGDPNLFPNIVVGVTDSFDIVLIDTYAVG